MGSAARHSTGRKAGSRQSSEGNRQPTRQKPKAALRKTKKPTPAVPLTPLLRIVDALSLVGATVDVTSSALDRSDDPELVHAATVLNEHVFYPLEKVRSEIGQHAATCKTPRRKVSPAKKKRPRAKTPYRKWKKP
jgi:hypothetical protein